MKIEHATTTTIDKIHAQSANEGNRLLPSVFTIEKGAPFTSKAAGPSALYVIEGGHLFYGHICGSYNVGFLGEFMMEDVADPAKSLHLTAGDVILVNEGTVSKISTPSKGRGESSGNSIFSDCNLFAKSPGFGIAYIPAPLVLTDLRMN